MPCKREFPHLVEMQKKYKNHGVVCMTVTADHADDGPKALKFLQRMNAHFENYHWIDTADELDARLGSTALPTVLVFGRDGHRAKLFTPDEPFTYDDVEGVVKGLLK